MRWKLRSQMSGARVFAELVPGLKRRLGGVVGPSSERVLSRLGSDGDVQTCGRRRSGGSRRRGYSGIWSIVARVKAMALSQISVIGTEESYEEADVITNDFPDSTYVSQVGEPRSRPIPIVRPAIKISSCHITVDEFFTLYSTRRGWFPTNWSTVELRSPRTRHPQPRAV